MSSRAENRALHAALYYLDTMGWSVVEIPPGTKGPRREGWNAPGGPITTPAAARTMWGARPSWGVGLVHGPSRTCALDVDDLEAAREVLLDYHIDLDRLLASSIGINSGRAGRAKALFQLPPDLETLPSRKLQRGGRPVLELRAGALQDVLPPTVHPTTGRPYRWRGLPTEITELPEPVAALWLQVGAPPAAPTAGEVDGPVHERHLFLASLAGSMRRRGASVPAIEAALLVENASRSAPEPLPEREVRRIAAGAGRWQQGRPPAAPSPEDWTAPKRGAWA